MKINLEKFKTKNTVSGMVFILIGTAFLVYSQVYQIGSASSMGPGYYPLLVSILLIIVGSLLVFKNK